MKPVIAGSGTLAIAFGAIATFISLWPSEGENFLASCKQVLKDRLQVPATYVRISATPVRRDSANLEQCMGWDIPDKKRQDEQAMVADMKLRALQDERKKAFKPGEWDRVSIWLE